MLPQLLLEAIDRKIEGVSLQRLTQAAAAMSHAYRSGKSTSSDEFQQLAYLITRLPATYAVISAVFSELCKRCATFSPQSILDIGAGPGTASWAAYECFPTLQQAKQIERDERFIHLGCCLATEHPLLKHSQWCRQDMSADRNLDSHDLVVISYAIGELASESILKTIDWGWQSTRQVFVVIEPGTPAGFARLSIVREHLLSLGGYIVAPCPHQRACPLVSLEGGDWCHFSQRLERTHFHRIAKAGALGYEDEKYTYLIVSKTPVNHPQSRVLRAPLRYSGHLDLVLCQEKGIVKEKVTRKEGERYKRARKLEWGDAWETNA